MKKNYYLLFVVYCLLFTGTQMSAQTHFFDDVEDQTDFAIDGFVGWQAFDYDGNKPDGTFHDFPNKDQLYAFMVYNPFMTDPVNTFEFWQPYSGNKYFVSFLKMENYSPQPTDAWLVGPELDAPNGGTFSFQVRASNSDYADPFKFKVGYSFTTTDKDAFTFFDTESLKQIPWKHYSYEIPANVKYVVITTVEISGFKSGLCFDDLLFKAKIKDAAPAAVSSVTLTPDAQGNNKITISWVNPSLSTNGSALSNLSSIQLYRGTSRMSMQLVTTIGNNVTVGGNMQYTDESIPASGNYYYAIIPVNSTGRGDYEFVKAFIGKEDIPGAPHYLLFEPNAQYENLIKWNAVDYGENGGVLNGTVSGYTLTRKSPVTTETLVDNVVGNSYLETPAPGLNLYTYSIQAHTENETGKAFVENKYSGLSEGQVGVGYGLKIEDYIPMSFSYSSHLSQSIYTPDMFSLAGIITSMNWVGSNSSSEDIPVALKVYLSTTDRANFSTNGEDHVWIYFGDQTLVFDGTMVLENDGKSSGVLFDNGFYYDPAEGKNLVVTLIRPQVENYENVYNESFYLYESDDYKTYYATGYSSDLSQLTNQPPTWQSTVSYNVPNMIYGNNENFGKLSIKIDHNGLPASDVSIEIISKATTGTVSYYKGLTDEEGKINNLFLLAGEYKISIFKEGFVPEEKEITITEGMDELFEASLSDVFPLSLSGSILTLNNEPIVNALLKFTGYSMVETRTDADGKFSLTIFQGQSYNLEVTHPLYATHTKTFVSEEEDTIEWEAIKLNLDHHPAYDVIATLNKQTAVSEIKWETPIGLYDSNLLQWGSGVQSTSWGAGGPEFTSAVRFNIDDLSDYQDGEYYLTHLRVSICNYSDIALEVYEAEPNGEPQLIYVQKERSDGRDWYTFQLDRPVAINPGKEFWMAVRYYNGYGAYPAGIDDGPCISGKGNYINEGAGWRTIGLTDKNWCIYGTISKITEAAPSSYTLSRGIKSGTTNPDTWTVLQENHTELTYSDDLSAQDPNVYRYAVKAVYPDGGNSEWSISNDIPYLQDFDINMLITNENDVKLDAFVALYGQRDNEGIYYEAEVSDGSYTFQNVARGAYKAKIWVPNFDVYEGEVFDLEVDKDMTVNMQEYLCQPIGLKGIKNENGSIDLSWDLAGEYKEEFEIYPDFEMSTIGDYILVDNDEVETYTFMHFVYPGEGSRMAYLIFNPYATTPPVEDAIPYSGRRYLANFGEQETVSDDWIIIPARGGLVSFYVRSIVSYALDEFAVYYSTTGTNIDDFKKIHTENYFSAPVAWTYYEFTMPEETKYIAIQNTTYDGYIMMLDDLVYQKPFDHALAYDIYLDDTKIASDITTKSYHIDVIPEANFQTIGVIAKYAGGESGKTIIPLSTVGIDGIAKAKFNVYPNPFTNEIKIEGMAGQIEATVSDISGKIVLQGRYNTNVLNLSMLNAGVYIIDVKVADGSTFKTRIVKK